ncbi:MAG: alpha-ketoacid dehydrogenase subunit beta [Actinobacteria bacterium]|nr:alpha-ketoacid dehydrogenase subunit beta [Actinomycetota bacterium]
MGRQLTYKAAINEAIRIAMRKDSDIIMLGEDIAGGAGRESIGIEDAWGGPYGVTKGLIKEFGNKRVFDTPISESGFIGAAIGAAMAGLRPLVELMYVDFAGVSFDQFLNQASKLRFMFGGQVTVPITVKTLMGAGWRNAGHHSQTLYSLFAHIPGWYSLAPSSPKDAKGGLLAAIRNDNPVILFEHKMLYNTTGDVPEEDYELQLGKGEVKKEGSDITIVALSFMVSRALKVADKLEKENISVEVIDPIWLAPLDEEIIIDSIKKTGKVLIIDEDNPRCNMATDIAALIATHCFDYLDASIKILSPPNAPVAYAPILEDNYLISEEKIEKAVKDILG